MRGTRIPSLAILALATVAVGWWVVGCSKDQFPEAPLAPRGPQTTPSGAYSIAWSNLEVNGSGRIVVPGAIDVALGADQVKDLAHSLLNVRAGGDHGWGFTPVTGPDGAIGLVLDPHPHELAKLLLAYDRETGRAEGSYAPADFPAPSAALNTAMKEFIVRTIGGMPQAVTATRFQIGAESYAFQWTPDATKLGPGDNAYPSLMASGLVIEGVFFLGETEGTFSATIDRLTGDLSGVRVSSCPECAAAAAQPPGRKPLAENP